MLSYGLSSERNPSGISGVIVAEEHPQHCCREMCGPDQKSARLAWNKLLSEALNWGVNEDECGISCTNLI